MQYVCFYCNLQYTYTVHSHVLYIALNIVNKLLKLLLNIYTLTSLEKYGVGGGGSGETAPQVAEVK